MRLQHSFNHAWIQSTSFALDTEIDFQGGKLHGSHDTAQIPLDNLTNKHEKVEVEEIVQSQKYPAPWARTRMQLDMNTQLTIYTVLSPTCICIV